MLPVNASLRRSRSSITARHVHLVEGGEHGGGVLRLDQSAGDRGAALGHALARLRLRSPARARRRAAVPGARGRRVAAPASVRAGVTPLVPVRRCRAARRHHVLRHARPDRWHATLELRRRASSATLLRRRRGPRVGGGSLACRGAGSRRLRRAWRRVRRACGGRRVAGAAAVDRARRALRRPSRPRLPACSIDASTPARSALTSRSIFSVSSSTSGSPALTLSPCFFSHFATRASTTDSPSSGTTIFIRHRS